MRKRRIMVMVETEDMPDSQIKDLTEFIGRELSTRLGEHGVKNSVTVARTERIEGLPQPSPYMYGYGE